MTKLLALLPLALAAPTTAFSADLDAAIYEASHWTLRGNDLANVTKVTTTKPNGNTASLPMRYNPRDGSIRLLRAPRDAGTYRLTIWEGASAEDHMDVSVAAEPEPYTPTVTQVKGPLLTCSGTCTVSAQCPSGTVVVGGGLGAIYEDMTGIRGEIAGSNRWLAEVRSSSFDNIEIQAIALCLSED